MGRGSLLSFMESALIFVTIVAMVVFADMPNANGGDYLGDVCLQIHATQNTNGPLNLTTILRLGLTYSGGNHYMAQGAYLMADNPIIVGGTCELIDNDVVCTLNYSQDHSPDPWRESGIMQIHLNGSDLSGSMWSNFISFNASTGSNGQGFYVGTVTLTNCP